MTDDDVMTRMGLEDRREELQELVAELIDFNEGAASAALFFGGRPVVGSRGIESEFGGNAVAKFQDLVAKLLVQEIGELGQRGPVPNKAASTMHITNVVRGSFGFLMEEVQTQGQLVDTALKAAVDDASRLMAAFADADEVKFQEAVEAVDQRVFATAGEFFDLLRQGGATFRIVAGDNDETFSTTAVERAVERATSTTVTEGEEPLLGRLTGALPDGHMFEFRNAMGDIVRGRVDRSITTDQLMQLNLTMLNVEAQARMRVRRVWKEGAVVRESFTLLALGRTEGNQAHVEQA
ncbi:MAG TPA: hypothetical protein VFZ91_13615 [Allosphingosinicella sp.]